MSRLDKERGKFIEAMRNEAKIPEGISLLVLRHARGLQTIAERECSDESAERDRVRCPGGADCLCRAYGTFNESAGTHGTVTRIAKRGHHLEARIRSLLAEYHVEPIFNGDPRGAVVKLKLPSGRTDDWGREGFCVPA